MRLTTKKIEEILVNIIGVEGLPLIRYLIGKENISEFDLANKTKKDIKIVRRLLYNLYNYNLIGFTRKKDKQKGWYIYYWTLLPESIRFNYFKMKRQQLEKLQFQLEEEQRELFFTCPNRCVRLDFDKAMEFEFHCPECGELIHQDKKKERVQHLKRNITKIQDELKKLTAQRTVRRKKEKIKKKVVKKKKKKKTVTKKKIKKPIQKKRAKKSSRKKVVKKKAVKKKVIKPKKVLKSKKVVKKKSKKTKRKRK